MINLELYTKYSHRPKYDAQYNLRNRAHYVDDDTLKYFNTRILYTNNSHDGLVFSLIESLEVPSSANRSFRFVIFDIAGNVIDRQNFDMSFSTKKKALTSLRKSLQNINAKQISKDAIKSYKIYSKSNVDRLQNKLKQLAQQ